MRMPATLHIGAMLLLTSCRNRPEPVADFMMSHRLRGTMKACSATIFSYGTIGPEAAGAVGFTR